MVEKIKRYLVALKDVIFKSPHLLSKPIHIQLEPTSYCNLSCRTCSYKDNVKNPRNLSFKDFKKIYDEIRPLKLTLSGVGETFLNPEIFQMISYAKDSGTNVNTSSNGTVNSKLAEKIVDSGLDLLKISIDSDNRETYKKVRDGDYFDDVIYGVKEVVRVKKERGALNPYVRFQFVIEAHNYTEIPGTIRLARELGVDAINFQILEVTGIEDRWEELIGDMTYDKLKELMEEGERLSGELGVLTNLKQLSRKLPVLWEKYSSRKGCPQQCILPWFSTYVDIDGNLRPCCSFGLTFTEANMGNVLKDGIEKSWNSERYQKFRRSIKNASVPYAICKTCRPQTPRDMAEMTKILPGFLRKGK